MGSHRRRAEPHTPRIERVRQPVRRRPPLLLALVRLFVSVRRRGSGLPSRRGSSGLFLAVDVVSCPAVSAGRYRWLSCPSPAGRRWPWTRRWGSRCALLAPRGMPGRRSRARWACRRTCRAGRRSRRVWRRAGGLWAARRARNDRARETLTSSPVPIATVSLGKRGGSVAGHSLSPRAIRVPQRAGRRGSRGQPLTHKLATHARPCQGVGVRHPRR
jgi:hypothetical protein